MAEIVLAELTAGTLAGDGVFDKLMAATKAHLEAEFTKNRIKGAEYSQVYLGALDNVLANSVQFLLQKKNVGLQADLLAKQILLAQAEIERAAVILQQEEVKLEILMNEKDKTAAEILLITAQAALTTQQKLNLIKDLDKTTAEIAQLGATKLQTEAQTVQLAAQTALTTQQKLNAVTENTVLIAQECKLRAEYDVLLSTNLKTAAETTLLTQKVATEKAQVTGLGVDQDSVIGRQKLLYQAQTDGFKRDAEQKAAKLYVDVWSARRMTDEATQANATNGLDEAITGQVMAKLRAGVGI